MNKFVQKTEHEEKQIVRRINEGDETAFEQLFKTYYFKLSRFAWRYVDSKTIAEELVQAVFADIWEERKEWQPLKIKTYLFGAVRNRAIDHIRHQKVRQKHDPKWREEKSRVTTGSEDKKQKKKIRKAIKSEVEALPSRSRMTFKLHYFDGLTYQETADIMEVSVKTVESQITRGLKQLCDRLSYLHLHSEKGKN